MPAISRSLLYLSAMFGRASCGDEQSNGPHNDDCACPVVPMPPMTLFSCRSLLSAALAVTDTFSIHSIFMICSLGPSPLYRFLSVVAIAGDDGVRNNQRESPYPCDGYSSRLMATPSVVIWNPAGRVLADGEVVLYVGIRGAGRAVCEHQYR